MKNPAKIQIEFLRLVFNKILESARRKELAVVFGNNHFRPVHNLSIMDYLFMSQANPQLGYLMVMDALPESNVKALLRCFPLNVYSPVYSLRQIDHVYCLHEFLFLSIYKDP